MSQTNIEPIPFRIRAGLAVHRKRLIKRQDGARTITEPQSEAYGDAFGRSTVELRPAEIASYAHALEPLDDRGAAALEALRFRPPVRVEETTDESQLARQVEALTIKALLAAGLLKLPKNAAA